MGGKRLLGDLSLLQVGAGALAAMTAAWLASQLGVAGTIIGAAVASVVASISTALYLNTLTKGRTLLVTESGTVVQRAAGDEPRSVVEHDDSAEADSGSDDAEPGASRKDVWIERFRRLRWKTVAILATGIFVVSFTGITLVELASGQSYGNSENPGIVRPGSPGVSPSPAPASEPAPAPVPTSAPTTAPTTAPPTEPVPTLTPTTEPPAPDAGPTTVPTPE